MRLDLFERRLDTSIAVAMARNVALQACWMQAVTADLKKI